ncbi:hypothetical protein A2230_08490 [candidate division WOR-1 bacterium RIFOXYA2_FULL_36_21]|uniref:DUF3800 domain-containing protein n=1 Tax=candidate division WOR-1 bacterium RIFOXYB2_FULL_36_35 TaxID=1802578 RepID=A0A1F4S6Y4_UNCSA|nr:MAG: hypothetical protein A2230_08490 [candidate division WOR-1 bacterium RIFOXYA2_FULL_36_21]OGC16205.1 MAG: hypothetical protein A2290_00275 [candidate division WOR-1 bacterium RIFOXYB2_FULL_36_35]
MWFLYLDESGDLGFDFINRKPSKFFTITILAIKGIDNNRELINCVKKVLKRKLNNKKNKKRFIQELKGVATNFGIKKYFYELMKGLPFAIFSLTLNKKRVYSKLIEEKERIYNYIARKVLDEIKFENATNQVDLIVDKSKGTEQIKDFNTYIVGHLQARLNPKVPLNILHVNSWDSKGIQAVDLFSWGIFRSYEKQDFGWLTVFKDKVKFNEQFL